MSLPVKKGLAEDKNYVNQKREPWYRYITVEPPMFLYMMAYMITNVIEQTYYVFRACTLHHGYSDDVCYNISSNREIYDEVTITVTNFTQWNGIASHLVPLILAFFLGSYSDKRGRKVILLAGFIGKLYFSVMVTLSTIYPWPLQTIIYAVTIPSSLTGADLAIFAGCFAYIADVSSVKNRSLRVGILDVVYLSTMPTGVAIGNVLYKVFNKSFTAMFAVNSSFMFLATLYCIFFLKWQTRIEQKSLREANVKNPIKDFFDINNIKSTIVTLTRRRSNNCRLILWFLLLSMAFYTFQRDERPVMYLYMTSVFEWDPTQFSNFRTYLSSAYVLCMLVGIPLLTKIFNWKDTIIVMLGASAHMTGHFLYAHATTPSTLYFGATAAALGPCIAPLIRSMTSKVLPASERGVAYAFLSVMENAVAMFASVIYIQIYQATNTTKYNNSIFYFTLFTQAVVFTLALSTEFILKGKRIEAVIEQDTRTITETESS